MTEQRIGFCTTSDGVRIAYASIGTGPAFVWVPGWVSHLELDWAYEGSRSQIEIWAQHRTVIRYDKRGTGLSDRRMGDYSIDVRVRDLEAVVDHLGLHTFALRGISEGGPLAIAYASRHPDRVSHLVLLGTYARGDAKPDSVDALSRLIEAEWGLASLTMVNMFYPGVSADEAQRYAMQQRESATPADAAAMIRAVPDIDVSDLLPTVASPTIVVHGIHDVIAPYDLGRDLASRIPNARLVSFDGAHPTIENVLPLQREIDGPIREFLGVPPLPESALPAKGHIPHQASDPAEATMRAGAPPVRTFASGRYTVVRRLGEGGQKVVYLVHDEALDRDCALSMVKAELLEADDLERLRREAQAMARLGAHSNIVTVHDIGEEDGKPYLVCEYVPAGDLQQHLRAAAAPLPLERILAIAADIARALAVAHGRGVIHRDVKPANVWLCDDGSAKLGDFGLAFSLDRTRMTIAGTVVGTATYMAPEQARGEPADARTDLYALGVILYEMVCGRPPFSGDDPLSVISQHASVAPAAPVLLVAGLPPELSDLILRLLAKAPGMRPKSAVVVGEELRAISERLGSREQPVE